MTSHPNRVSSLPPSLPASPPLGYDDLASFPSSSDLNSAFQQNLHGSDSRTHLLIPGSRNVSPSQSLNPQFRRPYAAPLSSASSSSSSLDKYAGQQASYFPLAPASPPQYPNPARRSAHVSFDTLPPIPTEPGFSLDTEKPRINRFSHSPFKRESAWASSKNKKKKVIWLVVLAIVGIIVAICIAVYLVLHRREVDRAKHKGAAGTTTDNDDKGTSTGKATGPSTNGAGNIPADGDYADAQFQALYYPKGFNGTGLSGQLSGGAVQAAKESAYDELLVFGSSYSDDGHPRAAQYDISYSGTGYWDKRWSNGPVWTEYLAGLVGTDVAHLNYAYAGAMTNNTIHPTGVPDTGYQVDMYLRDVAANGTSLIGKRRLVSMFTSTNPIFTEWKNYLAVLPEARNLTHSLVNMDISAQSLINQLNWLIPSSSSIAPKTPLTGTLNDQPNTPSPDFLILPIQPLHLAPKARRIAAANNVTTDSLIQLNERYNAMLMQGTQALAKTGAARQSTSSGGDLGGKVYTYDTLSLWYSMFSQPSAYNLTDVHDACGEVHCTTPEKYLWWDELHLVTSMQERLARVVAKIVLANSTT